MEAIINAERTDAHAEYGDNPVNAAIQNPVGDFPAEAFHEATEQVQAAYDADDFVGDGDSFAVGIVEYDDDGFEVTLY